METREWKATARVARCFSRRSARIRLDLLRYATKVRSVGGPAGIRTGVLQDTRKTASLGQPVLLSPSFMGYGPLVEIHVTYLWWDSPLLSSSTLNMGWYTQSQFTPQQHLSNTFPTYQWLNAIPLRQVFVILRYAPKSSLQFQINGSRAKIQAKVTVTVT